MAQKGDRLSRDDGFKAFQRRMLEGIARRGRKSKEVVDEIFQKTERRDFGQEIQQESPEPEEAEMREREERIYSTYSTGRSYGGTQSWDTDLSSTYEWRFDSGGAPPQRRNQYPEPIVMDREALERAAKELGLQVLPVEPEPSDTTKSVVIKTKRLISGEHE